MRDGGEWWGMVENVTLVAYAGVIPSDDVIKEIVDPNNKKNTSNVSL